MDDIFFYQTLSIIFNTIESCLIDIDSEYQLL